MLQDVLNFETWAYAQGFAEQVPRAYVVPHPFSKGWAVAVDRAYVREGDYAGAYD